MKTEQETEKAEELTIDGWVNLYENGYLTFRGWGIWPSAIEAIEAIKRFGLRKGDVYMATIPLSEYCS